MRKVVPNKTYDIILYYLRTVSPFSPQVAHEVLQSQNQKATIDLIEELVRRRLIQRTPYSTLRKPLYILPPYIRATVPQDTEKCYRIIIVPESVIRLQSPIIFKFINRK